MFALFKRFARLLHPLRPLLSIGLLAGITLTGLNAAAQNSPSTPIALPIPVVASFSILADITKQVGGDRVQVHALVGADADAHAYQVKPSDAKKVAAAKLFVVNGQGFDRWADSLRTNNRLSASQGIKHALFDAETEHGHENDHGHAKKHAHAAASIDPHAWQDLKNALVYVDNIRKALSDLDPAGQTSYTANAERYQQDIKALDGQIRQMIAALPEGRRKVVTSHDAFAYFGRAYGIQFIAPVGVSTESEASAGDVGRIIRQIRQDKIPAVFMENISNPRLLERIRQESGATIGGTLYSDALSAKGGTAATYLDMMRHNAKIITEALAE